jgi:hypothetical protein
VVCTVLYRYKVLYTHTDGTHIHDSCVQRTVISCFTFYLFVYFLYAYRGTQYLYRIYVLPYPVCLCVTHLYYSTCSTSTSSRLFYFVICQFQTQPPSSITCSYCHHSPPPFHSRRRLPQTCLRFLNA